MTRPVNKDLDRLPKWARDEILRLRDSVDYWQQKIAVRDAGASGISFTCDHERHHNLPDGTQVAFMLQVPWADDRLRPARFTVTRRDNGLALELRTDDGGLVVEPMAANTIVVRGLNW
jgi:hypothetical protein